MKHYTLTGGVQKILADPFEQKYFVIQSGSSLDKFQDEKLSVVDESFSAGDLAFYDKGPVSHRWKKFKSIFL